MHGVRGKELTMLVVAASRVDLILGYTEESTISIKHENLKYMTNPPNLRSSVLPVATGSAAGLA